jgi:pimeloyl-ACP methyl ester carboxylesterase
VLVGASIGGIFIRAFQHAYPRDVAGLVFSNSSNRVGLTVGSKTGLLWDLTEAEIQSGFPLPPAVKSSTPPVRESSPFDRLPPELQDVRLALDVQRWERWHPTSMRPDSMLSWRREFLREFAEMQVEHPLGALPVVVVSSQPAAGEREARSRTGAAAALDFLSTNTTHITATESCHEIHLCQPDKVVDGITRIVGAFRNYSSVR